MTTEKTGRETPGCAQCRVPYAEWASGYKWIQCTTCMEQPMYCPACSETWARLITGSQDLSLNVMETLQQGLARSKAILHESKKDDTYLDSAKLLLWNFHAIHRNHTLRVVEGKPTAAREEFQFDVGEREFWLGLIWEREKQNSEPWHVCATCRKEWFRNCDCGRKQLRSTDREVAQFREQYRAKQTQKADQDIRTLEQKLEAAKKRRQAIDRKDWQAVERDVQQDVPEQLAVCGHPTPFSTLSKCPGCSIVRKPPVPEFWANHGLGDPHYSDGNLFMREGESGARPRDPTVQRLHTKTP